MVSFIQEFKGIPVDASEIVVNIQREGKVQSIYNNYHYNIPSELDRKKIKVSAENAREICNKLLEVYKKSKMHEPEFNYLSIWN